MFTTQPNTVLKLHKLMTPSECQLCNAKLTTPTNTISHYNSLRHVNNAQKFLLQPAKATLSNVTSEIPCYVCKEPITDSEKNHHITSFPHKELLNLKIELAKAEIDKEFWYLTDGNNDKVYVFCNLCNCELQATCSFNSHFKSAGHKQKYKNWLSEINIKKQKSKEITKNPYYCKECKKDLDGTADAKKHYNHPFHKNLPKQSTISTANQTANVFKESMELLQNNLSIPPQFTSSNTYKSSHPNTSLSNISDESEEMNTSKSDDLKEQVFDELNKLVQKVYYSKIVPYELSLLYLKMINNHMDELGKQYSSTSVLKANVSTSSSRVDSPKKSTSMNDLLVKQEANITTNQLPRNVRIKIEKDLPEKMTTNQANQDKSISSLRDEIGKRKLEVEQINNDSIEKQTEKELLQEIDILLEKVDHMPLEETLQILIHFNEGLDNLRIAISPNSEEDVQNNFTCSG
ncbi:hypothetical protein ABEB36_002754 [Hypothenemus hampei]|uniref:C2H2-type domain-containing protein n=1 Tax=Hypothenemus hampei TaxID=57062 RepID=A0ABD1F6W3_HYPHA